MGEIVPEHDLFGGSYVLPPELRLLERFSLRLSPGQKARFFSYANERSKTPSQVLRDCVLSLVGDC
jgi:hypothetical protein